MNPFAGPRDALPIVIATDADTGRGRKPKMPSKRLSRATIADGARAISLGGCINSTSLENFEAYTLVVGTAENTNLSSMNSSSVVNGQGPGLLVGGCTYSSRCN